jgi:predicted nucleic acid-binding protein
MILLDSSFLVAYYNSNDSHHAAAARVAEDVVAGTWGRAQLLEYVFLEVVTLLLARRGLAAASAVGRTLLEAREVDFIPCSDLFLGAFELFLNQRDSRLSFTDAAIVNRARQTSGHVATFDRGIAAQPGITAVPAA